MALFFFLSGYGLSESERKHHLSFINFIKKRFWKLYKPILIVNTLHYIGIQASHYSQTKSWASISLGNILLIDNLDYYLWFVSVLFVCYLLFAISSQIKDSFLGNLSLLLGIAIAMLILWMCGSSVNHWISLPFFALGVLFSDYNEKFRELQKTFLYWVGVVAVITFCGYIAKTTHASILLHLDINIIQTILLILMVSKWSFSVPALAMYELSYPIYLIHHKVIDYSLWLGHMLPWWFFIILTIYIGWLLQQTNVLFDDVFTKIKVRKQKKKSHNTI